MVTRHGQWYDTRRPGFLAIRAERCEWIISRLFTRMEPTARFTRISRRNVPVHPVTRAWRSVSELLSVKPDLCSYESEPDWRYVSLFTGLLANIAAIFPHVAWLFTNLTVSATFILTRLGEQF